MLDFERFGYQKNRAIYSECQAVKCPNLEIQLIQEFLNRDQKVIFVTLNQPYYKLKKYFGVSIENPNLHFVDCISRDIKPNPSDKNVLYVKRDSWQTSCQNIYALWDSLSGKKLIFIDCAEVLLTEMSEKDAFDFIHVHVQKFQLDGIVIFCFLKGSVTGTMQTKIQHLFDQVIFL